MEVEGAYKAECKKHSVLSAKLKEMEEFLYLLPAYGGRRSTVVQLSSICCDLSCSCSVVR